MEIKKVIVIGGGISGCLTALLLARKGYEVKILEKESSLGGLFTSFERENLTFDIGFHYSDSLRKDQFLYNKFIELDILKEDDVIYRNVIDCVHIGIKSYFIGGGIENFRQYLQNCFPHEDKLSGFFKKIKEIYHTFNNNQLSIDLISDTTSLGDVINSLINSVELKILLRYVSLLYGEDSFEGQFNIHAILLAGLLEGASLIKGGSSKLVNNISKKLIKLNVDIMTNCLVEKIHLDNNSEKLIGVTTDKGIYFEANNVIYTAHPYLLNNLFAHKSKNVKRLLKRINYKENGGTAFICFFRNEVIIEQNHYFFDANNICELVLLNDESQNPQPVISIIKSSWPEWEAVKGEKIKELSLKKYYEKMTLAKIAKYMPDLAHKIKLLDSASPLTFYNMTGSYEGSLLGLRHIAREKGIATLLPFTQIKGFYLAGQSILYPGLVGCACTALVIEKLLENVS